MVDRAASGVGRALLKCGHYPLVAPDHHLRPGGYVFGGDRHPLADLRPEISGPLIEDAQRLAAELGLANSERKIEVPSDAELEALRGLGYAE